MRPLSLGMGLVYHAYGLHEQKAEGMALVPPRPSRAFRASPA